MCFGKVGSGPLRKAKTFTQSCAIFLIESVGKTVPSFVDFSSFEKWGVITRGGVCLTCCVSCVLVVEEEEDEEEEYKTAIFLFAVVKDLALP